MATDIVRRTVRRWGRRAGVPGRHHPHRWRHTYATELLRAGLDMHRVRRLLGHSDLQVTARYLHLAPDDLATTVGRCFDGTPRDAGDEA